MTASIRTLVFGSLLLLLPVLLPACFDPGADLASKPAPKNGQKIFAFDYTKVSELRIAKNDPNTGEYWSTRIQRNGNHETSPWLIDSYTGDSLLDRLADRNYILHLLDTLGTLRVGEDAPNGSLESFGLKTPRFAITWKERELMEIRFGNALEDGGAYAQIPGVEKVLIVRGAALAMLGHLKSFDTLRHRRLMSATADEVDELTFFRKGKKVLYAQRESDGWVDAQHRKLTIPAGPILEAISHLRVASFVDDQAKAKLIATGLSQKPMLKIAMSGRNLDSMELSFDIRDGKLWASESLRKQVFELPLEALAHLDRLPK